MENFTLKEGEDYIELKNLIKLLGWVDSGSDAHARIDNQEIKVNGEIETQRRKKIRSGDIVMADGQQVKVKWGINFSGLCCISDTWLEQMSMIKQYDTVELLEDLNPSLKKGMRGVILEKYTDEDFAVEFLDKDGVNIQDGMQFTFTVNIKQLKKVE